MQNLKEKIKDWLYLNIDKPVSRWILNGISFSESSFFPIPVDPFLAIFVFFKSEKWKKYVFEVTIFSVLGGLLGYLIGWLFFEIIGQWLVNVYHLQNELLYIQNAFSNNAFWAIFISAFTPIPYKVFTISAGLFGINLIIFIIASILGRGLRFLIVGIIFRYLGQKHAETIFKYFNYFAVVIGFAILLYFIF
jgi:membrane protein YqaA with SNARE-associated domain